MFATRVQQIQPFRVMQLLERARELERAGAQVVHLEVGEPDFPTAAPLVAAAQAALAAGTTGYTEAAGLPALRAAIAADYQQRLGVDLAPERVLVTAGASGALMLLAALLLEAGDELLLPDPCYPCNLSFLATVNANGRLLATGPETGFLLSAQQIAAHWRGNTRGVLLASPANPTGATYDVESLQAVLETLRARRGLLIMDEIYQGLVYPVPGQPAPAGTVLAQCTPDDQVYVVNSFSKFFGMTGWRLGWLVVPAAAVEPLQRLAQNLFIAPSTPAQYAALAAFTPAALAEHERRRRLLGQRRDQLLAGLQQLGFAVPLIPQGAFYLYVDIRHLEMDAEQFCWRLLNEFQVAVTPGTDFGQHQAGGFVRFAYTQDQAAIALALSRLAQALVAWGKA